LFAGFDMLGITWVPGTRSFALSAESACCADAKTAFAAPRSETMLLTASGET
jgi:hypothetical protein